MRNKLKATFVFLFAGLFSVATACGDDGGAGSPGSGDAGESGASAGGDGPMSSGGSDSDPNGGKPSGTAGVPSVNGGNPSGVGGDSPVGGYPSVNGGESGSGGSPSVNGGEPSVSGGNPSVNGGESGSGGSPSSNGGEPSSNGGAGGDGPVACTPITLGAFHATAIEATYTNYEASFTPNIVGAGIDSFVFSVQAPPLYDGDETGTFDLTENGDENYATCARCFLVFAEGTATRFYASQGTLVIAPTSTQLEGNIDATVTNLTLVEVTIDNSDFTSTPVPNGRCLTVASAEIKVQQPVLPATWSCPESWFNDDGCDCGCGGQDYDCAGTTNQTECDYCQECTGNFVGCPVGSVDPADTTMCL